jgi:hypothetical protein
MRPRRVVVGVAVGLALLLSGCRQGTDQPLDPVWGKQPCDHCAMLLDEPRFAAQATTPDGARLYFDDVGCLAAWLREHPAAHAHAWVRNGARWVAAEQARFTNGERTPMGYGYVAADRGVAWSDVHRALAARAGAEEAPHAQ